jgi:FtsH-binding integral membrane protein
MTEENPVKKTFMILVAALLMFAGPTYVVYALLNIADLNYFVSMGTGFVIFVVGLVFLLFLMRRKIVS